MQVVSEILSTGTASVAVVNAKERALWPCFLLAVLGLYNI
jgi:hypothetical protein